ncbi:MAG: glycosyltransferase [Thermoanaerobaculia bacterium]|nr:glycosyltransferase [Thermoanaerobaculia bacterium]
MARKATLIILTWNRWYLTRRCLETLQATDLADAEVMVVDNGSTDETLERLAEMDWVRVVALPENLGFVRGNNAGIAAADPSTDIVLLNNDVEFHQPDWLERLRTCAHSRAEIGVVGARLITPDERLLHAGTYILPDTVWGQQIGNLEKDIGQYGRDRKVEGIVFACAYIKREAIEAIGGLALDFQSYFEDTDYCLRARDHGFETWVCGGVTLVHDEHGSTKGDTGALMRIFQGSRKTFRKKWGKKLDAHYQREVFWQSIMNFPTGYAMSCREMLWSLEERGVKAIYRYVYGAKTVFKVEENPAFDEYRLNVYAGRKRPLRPKIGVVYGQGDVFERCSGRYKIGFTMLEVDGFPREWVRQANKMDEVWVPSEFNREAFLKGGLERPIHVIPLGVNPDYFHPEIVGHPNPMGEFVFLSVFEWGERKEPWMLLRAFNDVFRAEEPVRLLCKVVNKDPAVSLKREITNLGLREDGGKISYLFNQEFPRYQLGSLYRSADCFVSASRGEGWNMPLMEAMACGLPTIATDWGAHQEFIHEGNAYPLAVRGTVRAIAKCPYYEGFSWADPDPDHLRHLLREVYENRGEARRRGTAAAQEMAEKWTWDRVAEKIVERFAAIET